jgi:hypothetical protein
MKNKYSVSKDYVGERLEEMGLPAEAAKVYKLRNCNVAEISKERALADPGEGILIPYYLRPDGTPRIDMLRFRYCSRPDRKGFNAQVLVKKEDKYWQPKGTSPAPYNPPTTTNLGLLKATEYIGIVPEGEFKSIMVADTIEIAKELRMPFPYEMIPWVLGIGGADSWKNIKGGCPILTDLLGVFLPGSLIFLALDNDYPPNPRVAESEQQLARIISENQCVPMRMTWPGNKKGIDDYLAQFKRGEERVQALFDLIETAAPFSIHSRISNLNKRFAYIRESKTIIDMAHDVEVSPTEFKNSYLPGKISVPGNMSKFITAMQTGSKIPAVAEVKLASLWVDSPARFELSRFSFYPGYPRVHLDSYNTWIGWGVCLKTDKPLSPKKGDIKLFEEYVNSVLKYHNKEERIWFLQRIAWVFQHPMEQAQFWLNISGVPQTGKSGFVELITAVVGEAYASRPTGTAITESFNYYLKDKLLVSLDDTKLDAKKRDEAVSQFKKMVSESFPDINTKYVGQQKYHSCPLFIWTAQDPCFIESDDRRSGVFEFVSPEWDEPKWLEWDNWRASRNNHEALLYYFLNLSLEGFKHRGVAPKTATRALAVEVGLTEAEAFLYSIKERGGIVTLEGVSEDGRGKVEKDYKLEIFTSEDLLDIAKQAMPNLNISPRTFAGKFPRFGFKKWKDGTTARPDEEGKGTPVRFWVGPTDNAKKLIEIEVDEARKKRDKLLKNMKELRVGTRKYQG